MISTFKIFQTQSTMDEGKKLALLPEGKKLLQEKGVFGITAIRQTHGRGRGHADWIQWSQPSLKVTNSIELSQIQLQQEESQIFETFASSQKNETSVLPVTFVFAKEKIKIPLSWISQAVGCAVYDALEQAFDFCSQLEVLSKLRFDRSKVVPERLRETLRGENKNEGLLCLKWPNDVVFLKAQTTKKLCGILCEVDSVGMVYVGVGTNFFAPEVYKETENLQNENLQAAVHFSELVLEACSSLSEEKKKVWETWFRKPENFSLVRNVFCEKFETELLDYLFSKRTAEQLQSLVMEKSLPIGSVVSVNKGTARGVFTGLNTDGALVLQGIPNPIYSGEVEYVFSEVEIQKPVEKSKSFTTAQSSAQAFALAKQNLEELNKNDWLLMLDFGNTNLTWSFGARGSSLPQKEGSVRKEEIQDLSSLQFNTLFHDVFLHMVKHRTGDLYVFSFSVAERGLVSKFSDWIENEVKRVFPELKCHVKVVGNLDVLKELKLKKPNANLDSLMQYHTLGIDRCLRAAWGIFQEKKCLLFGCGTALTCEYVTPELGFAGGFIAPGFQLQMQSLASKTAQLPDVKFEEKNSFSGLFEEVTTTSALQAGALASGLGAIEYTVAHYDFDVAILRGGSREVIELHLKENSNLAQRLLTEPVEWQIIQSLFLDRRMGKQPSQEMREIRIERRSVSGLSLSNSQATTNAKNSLSKLKSQKPETNSDVASSLLRGRFELEQSEDNNYLMSDFRRLGLRIENVGEGERIDKYLAEKFAFYNREKWKEKIEAGEVRVHRMAPKKGTEQDTEYVLNGPIEKDLAKVKITYKLSQFDQVWFYHPQSHEPDHVSDCPVIFDDGDTIVFNKPGNLVIHATGIYSKNTFVEVAAQMGYREASPVHRIDRETSGILVCARSAATRQKLSDFFRQAQVKKMYLAFTRMSHSTELVQKLEPEFLCNYAIGPAIGSKIRLKNWIAAPSGVDSLEASTHFVKLNELNGLEMWACFPKTGRTNQIRIHLAALGRPIVGDKMYHENEDVFLEFYEKGLTQAVFEQTGFHRHMLHNAGIQVFDEPIMCAVSSDMLEEKNFAQLYAAFCKPYGTEDEALKSLFSKYTQKTASELLELPRVEFENI